MTRRSGWAISAALALLLTALDVPAGAKPCARLCRSEIATCAAGCASLAGPPRRRCRRACRADLVQTCRASTAASCTTPGPVPAGRQIVVNAAVLDASGLAVVASLEARYGVRVPDGRYWYDAAVGLWGREAKAPAASSTRACRSADRCAPTLRAAAPASSSTAASCIPPKSPT